MKLTKISLIAKEVFNWGASPYVICHLCYKKKTTFVICFLWLPLVDIFRTKYREEILSIGKEIMLFNQQLVTT